MTQKKGAVEQAYREARHLREQLESAARGREVGGGLGHTGFGMPNIMTPLWGSPARVPHMSIPGGSMDPYTGRVYDSYGSPLHHTGFGAPPPLYPVSHPTAGMIQTVIPPPWHPRHEEWYGNDPMSPGYMRHFDFGGNMPSPYPPVGTDRWGHDYYHDPYSPGYRQLGHTGFGPMYPSGYQAMQMPQWQPTPIPRLPLDRPPAFNLPPISMPKSDHWQALGHSGYQIGSLYNPGMGGYVGQVFQPLSGPPMVGTFHGPRPLGDLIGPGSSILGHTGYYQPPAYQPPAYHYEPPAPPLTRDWMDYSTGSMVRNTYSPGGGLISSGPVGGLERILGYSGFHSPPPMIDPPVDWRARYPQQLPQRGGGGFPGSYGPKWHCPPPVCF